MTLLAPGHKVKTTIRDYAILLYPKVSNFFDVFVVYVTHSFELIGVIEEAQDDIGDSDKDDDTNEEEALMHIYFN